MSEFSLFNPEGFHVGIEIWYRLSAHHNRCSYKIPITEPALINAVYRLGDFVIPMAVEDYNKLQKAVGVVDKIFDGALGAAAFAWVFRWDHMDSPEPVRHYVNYTPSFKIEDDGLYMCFHRNGRAGNPDVFNSMPLPDARISI